MSSFTRYAAFSALAIAGLGGFFALRGASSLGAGEAHAAAPAQQAMPVPVALVVRKTLPVTLDYASRTESPQNVSLQARISGYLEQQLVADGADVKAGDLLYKIDRRDYQAALDQARANQQREEAALDYARINLQRGGQLAQTGFLAKDSFDQRTSTLKQAEAGVAAAKAATRAAELNLDYTEIRAPFSGRLGRNQAPLGALLSPSAGALNSLVQLDPIYVTFNPSETDLAAIGAARKHGPVRAEIFSNDKDAPRWGELTFVNNSVDAATGTISARVTVDNHDFSLLPGQYVRLRLHLGDNPDALMAPAAAVGSSQLGKFLYVVGKDNVVEQRIVSLGASQSGLIAVTHGVSEGDKVIAGNLQKIGPGMPVAPLPIAN